VPHVPSFGASYRRFTRGLTVDGYKSRVNIVPVNSVGSERALGFDSSDSEGVVPAVCTCRYLRREIRKEKEEEGRSHTYANVCMYICVSKRLMGAPVSVTSFKCLSAFLFRSSSWLLSSSSRGLLCCVPSEYYCES